MVNYTIEKLIELDKKHFIHPTSSMEQQQEYGPSFIFEKGEGIYLEDIHGRRYIDARSSLWNVNVGHGRKELAEVAKKQMEKMAFSSTFATYSHKPVIHLSEKISQLTSENLNAVFYTSGGSEANDTAYKFAQYYWKLLGKSEKTKIISRERAYHGVSAGATSATGIEDFWKMGLLVEGFYHANSTYENDLETAINSIRQIIEREGPETIAAFVAEPIQGSGGVVMPPENYFQEIRKICDENDILFIADEVITGFGRTGKMFGMEHWNIEPDLLVFAKGVTSGYIPLGGVVVSDKIHNEFKVSKGVLSHGFTYSGHPVACAVALENIKIIENENLVENSKKMGDRLLKGFKKIEKDTEIIGNVRAKGLLGAIEILEDKHNNKRFPPTTDVAKRFSETLTDKGILSRPISFGGTDIIGFAPPLTINEEQIDEILKCIYETAIEIQKDI